jgi:hypothetical protein
VPAKLLPGFRAPCMGLLQGVFGRMCASGLVICLRCAVTAKRFRGRIRHWADACCCRSQPYAHAMHLAPVPLVQYRQLWRPGQDSFLCNIRRVSSASLTGYLKQSQSQQGPKASEQCSACASPQLLGLAEHVYTDAARHTHSVHSSSVPTASHNHLPQLVVLPHSHSNCS